MGFQFVGMAEGLRRIVWFALPALFILLGAVGLSWIGYSPEPDPPQTELGRSNTGLAESPAGSDPLPAFEGTTDEARYRGAYCPDDAEGRRQAHLLLRCESRNELPVQRRASR